jgi:hypothetical protein
MDTPIQLSNAEYNFASPHYFEGHPDALRYPLSYILSGEHPIWRADNEDGPDPLYCYSPGTRVLCPQRLEAHPSAITVGHDNETCGVICHDCRHIYHVDFRIVMPAPPEPVIPLK